MYCKLYRSAVADLPHQCSYRHALHLLVLALASKPNRAIWQTIAPFWQPLRDRRRSILILICSSCFGSIVNLWPYLKECGTFGVYCGQVCETSMRSLKKAVPEDELGGG